MFARYGALSATLAGALLVVGHLWSYTSESAVMGAGLLITAAHLALFFAIVALYQRLEGAPTAEAGTALAMIGNAIIMGLVFTHLGEAQGIGSAAAYEEGTVGLLAIGGILAFTLGMALIGLAIVNTGRMPSAVGGLFAVGSALAFIGGFTPEIVFVIGVVLGGVGLVWAGRELQASSEADVRTRVPA